MGFCVMDRHCLVYDKEHELPGYSATKAVCQGCADATKNDLNMLRYDYVDLSQLVPKGDARNDAAIHRPKPESSPPINMAVFTLRGDIAYFIALTCVLLRRHLRLSARTDTIPVREGYALDADIRWLTEWVNELALLPVTEAFWRADSERPDLLNGPDVMLALRALHRHARRMCGTDQRAITVPGHCPDCLTASLRRHDDDPDKYWCRHCRRRFDAAEYSRVVRLQIPADRNPTG